MEVSANTQEFLETVRPILETGDATRLAGIVQDRWSKAEIVQMLKNDNDDVRCAAALVVGLIGGREDAVPLAQCLQDESDCVTDMAEHGLWSLWFRIGKPEAMDEFRKGLNYMENESYDEAIECFERTAQIDPEFAEAHNQCAICHYFLGQWRHAIKHSRIAIKLMPVHFGAMAAVGHCYAQLENLPEALNYYKQAMNVNPNMPAIAGAIFRIQKRISRDERSRSDEFETDEIYRSQ